MALGEDSKVVTAEFVEAMRSRLDKFDPPLGDNVDKEEVRANFAALGEAVFRTITIHAETESDSTTDEQFWQWMTEVSQWLGRLREWQKGVVKTVEDWPAATPPEMSLREALLGLEDPGDPPDLIPQRLKGKIE